MLWPDLIVVGGGVSKDVRQVPAQAEAEGRMVPAKLLNTAGIVGAAWLAADRHGHPDPDELAAAGAECAPAATSGPGPRCRAC